MEKLEIENEIEKIPRKSGIYFLFDKNNQLLYIGKAVSLHFRLIEHVDSYRKHEEGKKFLSNVFNKYSIPEMLKFDTAQQNSFDMANSMYTKCIVIDKILNRVKKVKIEEYREEENEQKEKELIQSLKPPFNSQTACEEYYKIGKDFDVFERELLQSWESSHNGKKS